MTNGAYGNDSSSDRALLWIVLGLAGGAAGVSLDAVWPQLLSEHSPMFWGGVGAATGVLVSLSVPVRALLRKRAATR